MPSSLAIELCCFWHPLLQVIRTACTFHQTLKEGKLKGNDSLWEQLKLFINKISMKDSETMPAALPSVNLSCKYQ